MKGFRTPPQGSKNDVLRSLQAETQNNQMAIRMSQMLMKRMLEDSSNMGKDLGAALSQLTEIQYKLSAIVSTLGLDPSTVADAANVQRLKDFDEASGKADEHEQLLVGDTVTDDSTVTLTSTTDDGPDSDIFRSRIKLAEAGVPALLKGLLGQPVGTKVDVEIGGKIHHIELLSIRNPDPSVVLLDVTPPEIVQEQEVAQSVN